MTLPPRLRWIFRGERDIRAGWSVLIFLCIIGVLGFVAGLAARHYHLRTEGDLRPAVLILGEAVSCAVVGLGTWVMARIERRPVAWYGFSLRHAVQLFACGCAGGLACLALLAGALHAGGYLEFDGFALHGPAALGYGLAWLLAFALVGLSEEAIFRGYVQATLARGMGFWPAAALLSAGFAAVHLRNGGETAAGIAGVFAAGMAFCLLLRASGSLWLGIGFHTTWDWAQSFLFGTPDSGLRVQGHWLVTHAVGDARFSGGSAGPEGSLPAAPVTIAGLLLLVWVCRRAGVIKKAVLF